MAETPMKDWKSGLFDCLEDANTCCYGFWCCPCLACTVSGRFKENHCLPLCDMLTPAVFAACGIPLAVPAAAVSLRASIRNKHKIKGSICSDMLASCFCLWCVWCQMHREIKDQTPVTVVVQQPQAPQTTVINVHAHPVMNPPPNPGLQSHWVQNFPPCPPYVENPVQSPSWHQKP